MKKAIKIENINIDFSANNNDEDVHFEGSVTITWKTRKVLTEILEGSNNVTCNFLNGDDEIDFSKFEMMDEFKFTADVPLPENTNRGWNGPKFHSGSTAMNRENGWSASEITKLKKLGIIEWINAGENGCGDWDSARIHFHHNCQDKILLFKDVITKSELEDQRDELEEGLVTVYHSTVDAIKRLGIDVEKDDWNSVEDVIVAQLRDAISRSANNRRDKARDERKKKDEIKALKSKVRALEGGA